MKKFNYLSLIIILIFFFVLPNNLLAGYKGNEEENGKKPVLQKTLVNPSQSLLNINNATMWVAEDGFHDWVVASGWSGAFPNGTTVGAIFTEGIVWGGLVSDGSSPTVRVNGNTYGTGCSRITRLYRVRPDYLEGDLASDAASFNQIPIGDVTDANIQSLRNQYAIDWDEWPVNEGAPFEDVNNNGTYEPGEDIPGIPGASQTLFIKYNDALSASNYGSPPIGLEVSETFWAYAASGPLANVIYKKVNIVYKGTATTPNNARIDSMYIVQWADPDVGNSTDDFAGCDTTLNMGYAYSSGSSDATYAGLGLAPPAVGYDFLQGVSTFTGNPSDSAIFDLKWRKGYKYVNRKPMSSFVYFAAGGNWSDPGFNYNGTLEFYNLMRGKLPTPRYPTGVAFPEEVADVTADGTYLLAGDPVNGLGKIDGSAEGPGDRRIMVTNGPITMFKGDTAQVVLAQVYGLGRNNLSSISVMKFNDASAQFAYDQLFQVPLMPTPKVDFAVLDGKISAYWNQTEALISNTEEAPHGPYEFQAYALYQLPAGSSDITKGIRITTFDKVDAISFLSEKVLDEQTGIVYTRPLVPLNNVEGIKRNFVFDRDYINNKALISGQSYTFAITSIGYNDDPGLPSFILESAPAILNVTPQSPDPGVRLPSSVGDTLMAVHTGGGDGTVFAIVIDPARLTGHEYKVTFDDVSEPGTVYWNLIDVTDNNRVVLANQTNQSGDNNYPVVDGFQIKVVGPPAGMKDWDIPQGTRRFTWAGAAWGLEGFEGAIGKAYGNWFGNSTVTDADLKTVKLVLATADATGSFDVNDPNVSYGYRWLRGAANPPAEPQFAPFIVNPGGGYAYQDFTQNTPLSAWNMETDPPTRLAVGVFENNVVGGFVDGKYWPGDNSVTDNTVSREFLFVMDVPYSTTPDPAYQIDCLNNELPFMWWIAVNRRGNAVFSPGASGDDEFLIIANHISTSADEFTFSTKAATYSSTLAKEDVGKINVFPNPYYGFQVRETAPNNKYVTFNHLPDNAVIRIFDLSGVLVRTINHESGSGQFDIWDLQNDNNYPVASGIYVVYIDMPELGTTKILKLAVVQEQQMLKVY
ncbi:MAG TPA: hypothetical protein DHV28_11975 [Ignavibacteriales bacterium]|nr:hypothetical protein [Ignavibacteriales bacterium]